MDEQAYVIFAELKREHFDDILDALMKHFPHVQFGRQGDDWIWVHFDDDKIEIDSFFSTELEVKGRRSQAGAAMSILELLDPAWVIKRFQPFKKDHTR
jgi:hypothetical protein